MNLKTLFITLIIFVVSVLCQRFGERTFLNNELAQIPSEILKCYSDRKIWDRFNRLPYSVDSLIAIVRKIELSSQVKNWSPGQLAAALVHSYRFDGIQYDRCKETFDGTPPLRLDLQTEYTKMQLIWQLVEGNRDEFPQDILTTQEKCSLHWMMSYSINITFREDEYINYQDNIQYSEHRDARFGFSCESNTPLSLAPAEMGVVESSFGPVAAGTLLTGIAAGFRPRVVNWPTNEPNKRTVKNEWAATLAGDLAQTALLRRKGEKYVGPSSYFNSSLCPRESVFPGYSQQFFISHLTTAETNGGIDGLLIGQHASELEVTNGWRLSEILDEYYNFKKGIKNKSGMKLQVCARYDNYLKFLDTNQLSTEATTFGLEYKSWLVLTTTEAEVTRSIQQARLDLTNQVKNLQSYNYFCKSSMASSPLLTNQNQQPADIFNSSGIADVALILDPSYYSQEDFGYQFQVASALALKLDIWSTSWIPDTYSQGNFEMVDGGSTLEVSEGGYGHLIFDASKDFYNKAELACAVEKAQVQPTGDAHPAESISLAAARMAERRIKNLERRINRARAQVIVLFSFSRIPTPDLQPLRNVLWRLRSQRSDVKLIAVTRWSRPQDFAGIVEDIKRDVILLHDRSSEINAIYDASQIANRISEVNGPLAFLMCSGVEYQEYKSREVIHVIPGTRRFLTLHPRYFFASYEFNIVFQVKFNGVKICWSLSDLSAISENENCQEVSTTGGRIVFNFKSKDLCQHQVPDFCSSIFFRLQGVDNGEIKCRIDELFPCRTSDSTEILITHEGMTCSGLSIIPISAQILIAVFSSLFYFVI